MRAPASTIGMTLMQKQQRPMLRVYACGEQLEQLTIAVFIHTNIPSLTKIRVSPKRCKLCIAAWLDITLIKTSVLVKENVQAIDLKLRQPPTQQHSDANLGDCCLMSQAGEVNIPCFDPFAWMLVAGRQEWVASNPATLDAV